MATTMQNVSTKDVEQLFELGAHLGHRKSRIHPKSYKYIHKVINGVSIIDLTKTVHQLNKVRDVISEYAKDGKKILVVATKKNVAQIAAELCAKHSVPYTTSKWLPGLLTNFDTIMKNVQKMEEMIAKRDSEDSASMVKHERTQLTKQIARLERFYRGLAGMRKRPDMLLIVDVKREKNALNEAAMYKIPVSAIADTNSNPEEVTYPIVMNDDAPEVVQFVLTDLIELYAKSYQEPQKKSEAVEPEAAEPVATAPKAEKKAEPKKEDKKETKKAADAKEEPKKEDKAPAKTAKKKSA